MFIVLMVELLFESSPRLTAIRPPTLALTADLDVIEPLKVQSFTVTVHPPITSAAKPPILWLSVLRSSSRLALYPHLQLVKLSVLPSHRARKPPCHARSFFVTVVSVASSVTDTIVFTVTLLNAVLPLARPIADATNAGYLMFVFSWFTVFGILQLTFPTIVRLEIVTSPANGISARL